ncbi:hypothetical protein PJM25_29035, partial [Mycobacterium kansasii]
VSQQWQSFFNGIGTNFDSAVANSVYNANLLAYNVGFNTNLAIAQVNGAVDALGTSIAVGINNQIAGFSLSIQQGIHQAAVDMQK